MQKIKLFVLTVLLTVNALAAREAWEWDVIDTDKAIVEGLKARSLELMSKYGQPFLGGTAANDFQTGGSKTLPYSNWAHFEMTNPKAFINGQHSGISCDGWNRYKEDTELMKDLGCNACRISVDWSSIEPKQGEIDRNALQHYHDRIDLLIQKGITPMIALHHFVNPQWFEEIGAFSKEENIHHFVNFCKLIFEQFSPKVHLWVTIIEPGPFTFLSHIEGVFPPGDFLAITKAGRVLANLMKAHIRIYKTLKNMPNGDTSMIGINHQYLPFVGYYPWDQFIAGKFSYIFNTVILRFLKTGYFSFSLAPGCATTFVDKDIKTSFDFFGLNYYSEVVIRNLTPSCYDNEIMTDMPYAIYAEGFYEAIKDVSRFKKPIYITENGIGDIRDDRREIYIKRYLYAMVKAMKDFNADIRGYFYWTLTDNLEWEKGRTQKFGLYKVNFATQERTLYPGAACIKNFFRAAAVPATT